MSLEAQNIYRKVNPVRGWADILQGPITSSIFTEYSVTFLITEGTDPCDNTVLQPAQQLKVVLTVRCCECSDGVKPNLVAQEFSRKNKVFKEINSYTHNFQGLDDLFYGSGCFDVTFETCLERDPLTGCPTDQLQFDVTLSLEELSAMVLDIWSESSIVEGSPFDFWPLRPDSAFPTCSYSLECAGIEGVWAWQFVLYYIMAPLDLPYYSVGAGSSIVEAFPDFAQYLGTTTLEPPFSFMVVDDLVEVYDANNEEVGFIAYSYCASEDECPPGYTLVDGVCQFDPPIIPPEGCFDEAGNPVPCSTPGCDVRLEFIFQTGIQSETTVTQRKSFGFLNCNPSELQPTYVKQNATFSGIPFPTATNWASLMANTNLRNSRDVWVLPGQGNACNDYQGPSWKVRTQGSFSLNPVDCGAFPPNTLGKACGLSSGSIGSTGTIYELETSLKEGVNGCERLTKIPIVNNVGGSGSVSTPFWLGSCNGQTGTGGITTFTSEAIHRHFVRPRDCNGYIGNPIDISGNPPDPPDPPDNQDPPMCWYRISLGLRLRVRIPLRNGVFISLELTLPIFRKVVKSETEISNVVLDIVEVVGEEALDVAISWATGTILKRVAFKWIDNYVSLGPDLELTLLRCEE